MSLRLFSAVLLLFCLVSLPLRVPAQNPSADIVMVLPFENTSNKAEYNWLFEVGEAVYITPSKERPWSYPVTGLITGVICKVSGMDDSHQYVRTFGECVTVLCDGRKRPCHPHRRCSCGCPPRHPRRPAC